MSFMYLTKAGRYNLLEHDGLENCIVKQSCMITLEF